MRVVIILVALSFVAMLVPVVFGGLGVLGGGTSSDSGSSADAIASQYQPRVDSALSVLQASPDSPDALTQVGHSYYEWAVALYESGQAQASIPLWLSAVTYYEKSLAIRPDDDIVLGNRAFALYYGQDANAPAGLEDFITAASDNTGLAQQVQTAQEMLTTLESSTATQTP
jgi:tetratricopeptide (TPR) repeat protein